MPATISVTETGLTTALQMWLAELLGIEWQKIALTQQNRVPMLKGVFIYMTPWRLTARSYTRTEYLRDTGERVDTRVNEWRVQLDFYGPEAFEQASIVSTMLRTDAAVQMLADTPITPLYADDPAQGSIIDSEQQWEQRWTLDAHFQADIAITTGQQFAESLNVNLVEIDTHYQPG